MNCETGRKQDLAAGTSPAPPGHDVSKPPKSSPARAAAPARVDFGSFRRPKRKKPSRRKRKVTKELLIEAARQAAKKCRGYLSLRRFQKITGISAAWVSRCFPDGRWSKLRQL